MPEGQSSSFLEERFRRENRHGFTLLAAMAALALFLIYFLWTRESAWIRRTVDNYTREEALTLARLLLYDLAGDARLRELMELEKQVERLQVQGVQSEERQVGEEVFDFVAERADLPDALIWREAEREGLKTSISDISRARCELYIRMMAARESSLEDDLWARITFSDHLRGIHLRAASRSIHLGAGDQGFPMDESLESPVREIEGRGLLVVNLPLYIGAREWGRMWCLMDRSNVTAVGEGLRRILLLGQVTLTALLLCALAAWLWLWISALKRLRVEVIAPIVELAQKMEMWEQDSPPEVPKESETEWLSEAFDRLLARVQTLLKEREAAMEKIRSQQEALIKAERLGLLEKVGAGLSHELNNALNPAKLRLEEIILAGREATSEDLSTLLDHLGAAQRILKDLGAATRKAAVPLRAVGRGEWLDVALRLVEPHFKLGLELKIDVPDDISPVWGNPQRLIQALVNLLLNARDAALSGGGEQKEVRLAARESGGEVIVSVEDNGPGVPEEIRDSLFEPFVSSKSGGSGLGLFFVEAVLKGMGGGVSLAETGSGLTRFEMSIKMAGRGGGVDLPAGVGDA